MPYHVLDDDDEEEVFAFKKERERMGKKME